MAEIGLFEAIYSARSLRRFKPDPVPDDVITKVLDAAIRAPSGSNQQSWEFVVVKDAAQRKKIGAVYQKGGAILKALYADRVKPEHMTEDTYNKLTASAYYLIDHMADAPVLLIVCLKQVPYDGSAAQAAARSCSRDEEPGANFRLEHLSRRAEYYSRMPRTGPRHGAHHYSHVL